MGTYVTDQGLAIPSVETILDEIGTDQRGSISPLLNTDADSPIGQINAPIASHLREAWEVLSIAYNGNNPNACEGFLLEAVSAITGTSRAPATRSKFVGSRKVRVNLRGATTLPAGSKAHVLGDESTVFRTISDFTSPPGAAADYLIMAECEVTGPITCNAGTLTVIATPVSGWNSITNDFDAELGSNEDDDPQLRIRRENELRAIGSGSVDAIRARLQAIKLDDGTKPVIEAVVLENVTNATDARGLPPHSIAAIVYDGINPVVPSDLIAQTIWDSKSNGAQTYGSDQGTAYDDNGDPQVIKWSRPTIKEVFFRATLVLSDPNETPAQYSDRVKAAIIARFALKVKTNSVIRVNHYEAAVTDLDGIDDCTIQIGFSSGTIQAPGVNLTLGAFERAFTQTTGIVIQ